MDITITPGKLRGTVGAIPSKSQAHRLLICAALARGTTRIECPAVSQDILATAGCLAALGAKIRRDAGGFTVEPGPAPAKAELDCGESGSTLRFLLPVAGALGVDATFRLHGRLPQRPLSPLWEEMERMGCDLSRPAADTVRCRGVLRPGQYALDGGVSSQFISGLLFALPLLAGDSTLRLLGKVESMPYIEMTRRAVSAFGGESEKTAEGYRIPGSQRWQGREKLSVEGDWSNGAFWLCAEALGSPVVCQGLDPDSPQGDRACRDLFPLFFRGDTEIDAAQIPDLVPILSVAAACGRGVTRIVGAGRLRIKESDRLATVAELIRGLGGRAEELPEGLVIYPTGLRGGTVSAAGDHRIAMSAAIAATVCREPVTVLGAEAVEKSYPAFWRDYEALGGNIVEGASK